MHFFDGGNIDIFNAKLPFNRFRYYSKYRWPEMLTVFHVKFLHLSIIVSHHQKCIIWYVWSYITSSIASEYEVILNDGQLSFSSRTVTFTVAILCSQLYS